MIGEIIYQLDEITVTKVVESNDMGPDEDDSLIDPVPSKILYRLYVGDRFHFLMPVKYPVTDEIDLVKSFLDQVASTWKRYIINVEALKNRIIQ